MIITLPYCVPVGKKDKKFYINLNQYRNTHYHTLNAAKIVFKELIQKQINLLPQLNVIKLHYRVFAPTKQRIDTNNVASIADKFFCDALVEAGKIEDDNYNFLIYTGFEFGGIDKGNPRVEVQIEETQPMKMIFGTDEIIAALQMYVNQVLKNPINEPQITLEGLGDGSFQASMNVSVPKIPVTTYRDPAVGIHGGGSTRAAVSEALKVTKPKPVAKEEADPLTDEQAEATSKPTLLKPPVQSTQSIMKPKPVEPETKPNISTGEERVDPVQVEEAVETDPVVTEPEENPTEPATTPAGSTEPTADAFVDMKTEPKETTSGIGGKVEEPKSVKSIFSFKSKN